MIRIAILSVFCLIGWCSESSPVSDDPWDVDGPCQVYVEKFARAQADIVQCATNWSVPPKVCTNCFDEYIAFKQVEYETWHLDNVTSLDNRTCTQVIYDNYLLSYSNDISNAVSSRIWESSRCESCIHISWNFTANDSRVEFLNRTLAFQERLFSWRDCVVNFTSNGDVDPLSRVQNGTTICEFCKKPFDSLFTFYWDIYVKPGIDFCVDVETTMNDTLHLWNNAWQCAEKKDRKRDTALVIYTMLVLLVLTALFYAGSYIQGGGGARNLIRYSRMAPPRGQRSRLLTSSASDASLATVPSVHSAVVSRSRPG